jgi:menaquinone-dependent protoporphyrinogen oxidase
VKVLVTVASKHGSTREIAAALAEELRHAAIETDLRALGTVHDLTGYDAVIFGSAIYMGSWLPEAQQFARQHQATLGQRPVWVFSSGPLGAETPRPPADRDRLTAPLGAVAVRDHQVFVGKLDPADLGLGERLAVKVVQAPAGDFRDWAAIRGWAQEIAATLHAAGSAPGAGIAGA